MSRHIQIDWERHSIPDRGHSVNDPGMCMWGAVGVGGVLGLQGGHRGQVGKVERESGLGWGRVCPVRVSAVRPGLAPRS